VGLLLAAHTLSRWNRMTGAWGFALRARTRAG
jgi:hypothetical protein